MKVLKSARRADTYVFLRVADDYDDLPDELRATLGEATLVVEFHLHADRQLAQAEAPAVMAAIERQGFYLQLPPPPVHLPGQSRRDG